MEKNFQIYNHSNSLWTIEFYNENRTAVLGHLVTSNKDAVTRITEGLKQPYDNRPTEDKKEINGYTVDSAIKALYDEFNQK
jgi:hypothetical protein